MTNKLRSDKIKDGRYYQGGESQSLPSSIGWFEMHAFPKSPTDVTLVIPSKYHLKPWLLAHDAYGKAWLGWFILQYNGIINELDGFVAGAVIKLPTSTRMNNELLNKTVSTNNNKFV